MAIEDVRAKLADHPAVVDQILALTIDSVCGQFGPSFSRSIALARAEHDWQYLLLLASVFAGSASGRHQDVALRIAQHCLQEDSTTGEQKGGAGTILESLANAPALQLAFDRRLLSQTFQQQLPPFLRMEQVKQRLETTLFLRNTPPVRLNRFQHAFWTTMSQSRWLSVSAPTSAGKSFVVTRWLIETMSAGEPKLCVFIVPTRALIQQIESDLKQHGKRVASQIHISSIPRAASLQPEKPTILVFTQERLHVFLMSMKEAPRIDYLVVDEAQKIGDRHRGVMLQLVIEQVVAANPAVTVAFLSPMTENPDALNVGAPPTVQTQTLRAEEITVNQNLLWLSQVKGKPKLWNVSLCLADRVVSLGELTLSNKPSPESKRLPFVAHAIADGRGGNIVYVNGAADAETTALQLYSLVGQSADVALDPDIQNLVQLIEQTVHSQYVLRQVVTRGIAFHYGNIPLAIRNEVERLFSLGIIKYLVCTSTLVEGVNTSCRTICVRGPQKGRGKPMTADDFWNLAGRAGRLGREFQGNIVCVDADKPRLWNGGEPPKARTRYRVTRTTDTVLADHRELAEFVRSNAPRVSAQRRPDLEYVFSYLMGCHRRYDGLRNAPWVSRLNPLAIQELADLVTSSWERISLPDSVVLRNPTINPLALQDLFNSFVRDAAADPKSVEDFVPADPASDDVVDNFTKVFSRCAEFIVPSLGPPGPRCFVLAMLVTRWMRGLPLARLVQERIDYWTKGKGRSRPKKPNQPTIIRSVLEDVEQVARFEAPRALAAYTDVLRTFLDTTGREVLSRELSDLSIYLELGVSLPTQISLMALGLSRATAIRLSEVIADENLSEKAALQWLQQLVVDSVDLPELMKREIQETLSVDTV